MLVIGVVFIIVSIIFVFFMVCIINGKFGGKDLHKIAINVDNKENS